AVKGFGLFRLEFGFLSRAGPVVKPSAEPVCGSETKLQRPGVRVGRFSGGEFFWHAELLVAAADVLGRGVKAGGGGFDQVQHGPGRNGNMEIAVVDAIFSGREQVLLYIGRTDAAFGAKVDRPAMSRSALVDHGAFYTLVKCTDEERQRAA